MSIHPAHSLARRGILPMMDSASTDLELRDWLRWASESGSTPVFVRTVAEAALIACSPDYALLRPVLLELKRRYPEGWRSNLGVIGRHHGRGAPNPPARAIPARCRTAQPCTWQSAVTAHEILRAGWRRRSTSSVCSSQRNRVGGARRKRGSQRARATLRREVHAAREVLEARVGAQGIIPALHTPPWLPSGWGCRGRRLSRA
jgi:hypothetical protein